MYQFRKIDGEYVLSQIIMSRFCQGKKKAKPQKKKKTYNLFSVVDLYTLLSEALVDVLLKLVWDIITLLC